MKNGARRGENICMYLEHISGSDLIWGVMDALLEERTHNLGQIDEKELSRSGEPMIPTERKSTNCKGLKVQMNMANWQNEEKSHINEGERRDDKNKSKKVGKDLTMAKVVG